MGPRDGLVAGLMAGNKAAMSGNDPRAHFLMTTSTASSTDTASANLSGGHDSRIYANSHYALADGKESSEATDFDNWIYYAVVEGGEDDDDEDEDDDRDKTSVFTKSLGPQFRGVEDLVTHPHPGDSSLDPSDINAPPADTSDFDYSGEYEDYKYTRAILREMNEECAELAATSHHPTYLRAETSDGSKKIMADYHNAYWKHHTGQPALQDGRVSDKLQKKFRDAACDESGHRRHMLLVEGTFRTVDEEEPYLNAGYFEYPQKPSTVEAEDYDICPVSVEPADVVIGLHQSGNQRAILTQKMHVRKDLPEDPHLFATSRKGTTAARVLQEYQADDEQITRVDPFMTVELPHFEDGLMLKDLLPDRTFLLHEDNGPHEDAVQLVLYRIQSLAGQEELYEWNRSHSPGEIEETNEYTYDGLEHEGIVEIWNRLCEGRPTKWTRVELHEEGLLNPENEFGDNPEYLHAKLLMWQKRHGICGLEAIVRRYVERMRALCRPSTRFLSALHETELNVNSSDWPGRPGVVDVPKDSRYFDKLHAEEVDFEARESLCVELWRYDIDEVLPHDFFDPGEEREQAYHALLEYQNDREPGTEEHADIEDWARPVYMSCSSPLEMPAFTGMRGGSASSDTSFSATVETAAIISKAPSNPPLTEMVADMPSASSAQVIAPSLRLPSPQHLGEDETTEAEQIAASSPAMQTKTSSQTSTIPVIFDLNPTSSHMSGSLIKYIRETREDKVIDPADPIFTNSKAIPGPSICVPTWAKVDGVLAAHKTTVRSTAGGLMEYIRASREDGMTDQTESICASHNAGGGVPSQKMLASFLQRMASNALSQTGIKAPPGIGAADTETENATCIQELGTCPDAEHDAGLCECGRAPVGLSSSPSARARPYNPSGGWPSAPFSRQTFRSTEPSPYCLLES